MSGDREVLEAFRSAVAETMEGLESEMKTRVRKSGQDEERAADRIAQAREELDRLTQARDALLP